MQSNWILYQDDESLLTFIIFEGQLKLAACLGESIGARAEKVIVHCITTAEFCIVSKLIEGVKIQELLVQAHTITTDIRQVLEHFIGQLTIIYFSDFVLMPIDSNRITIDMMDLTITDPGTEASKNNDKKFI